MTIRTISEAAFDACPRDAQKASEDGPVIITKDDRPAFVLMSFERYELLSQRPKSVAEAFYMPGVAEIELELPERKSFPRDVDLS